MNLRSLYITSTVSILTILLLGSKTWAVEEFKITADDAEAGDCFGNTVSVSGDYAIVGTPGDDNSSGSAYIFIRNGDQWQQQQKLTAEDAAAGDEFGCSVSICGDFAIVGAYGDDDDGDRSGSAYIFLREDEEWTQIQKLTVDDAANEDMFGYSVNIYDDFAIVGSFRDDDESEDSGSAYIFSREDEEWIQQQKLNADDAAVNDWFGCSVAICGVYAIVGAKNNDDGGANSGSAYIFEHVGEDWTQQQKLNADDAASGDIFGEYVSICGEYAIIGARGNDDSGDMSGAAYIFIIDGDEWIEHSKLNAEDASAGDGFGWTVSISDNYAIIGASGDDDDGNSSGSSYLFVINDDEWIELEKLTAGDAAADDGFGYSVHMSSSYAIVGAFGDDDDGESSGSAYLYTLAGEISISPDEMIFGEVYIGNSEESVMWIVNEGEYNLIISEIMVDGEYYETDFNEEAIIPPDDTLAVIVTFRPEELGDYNGSLTIISNDPDDEEVTIELHGVGDIAVKFDRLEFYENVEPPDSNPENFINPNRNVRFKVRVTNELNRNILMGHGTIESLTEGVEVINESVAFNNIRSGRMEWSTREFEVFISEEFAPGGYAIFSLLLENEVEPQGPWISSFGFPITSIVHSRILTDDDENPDSNGDDDDIAEPGETIEIIPLINNISQDTWFEVSGQLRFAGRGNFIIIWDGVEGVSGVVLDTWGYNFIHDQQQPIEPDDENVQPEEDFVFEYSEDAPEVYELPFDLIISGYYNESAGDEWDEGGVLMKWSSRFIINEGEDEIPTLRLERPIADVAVDANCELFVVADLDTVFFSESEVSYTVEGADELNLNITDENVLTFQPDVDFTGDSLEVTVTADETGYTVNDQFLVTITSTSILDDEEGFPSEFSLSEPYPNPFNSTTTITYGLAKAAPTRLALYDLSGREVITLFEGYKQAGYHTATLTSGDLASGLYFVRLDAGGFSQSRKLVLVR